MNTSELYSLDLKDLVKGLVVAAGGAAITAIENIISSGSLTFNWKQIGLTSLGAGLAYLGKNFFTPAKIVQDTDNSNS